MARPTGREVSAGWGQHMLYGGDKLRVEAMVRVEGELKPVSELDDEQRRALADWLRFTYLNELFRGRAVFRVKKAEGNGEKDGGEACGNRG